MRMGCKGRDLGLESVRRYNRKTSEGVRGIRQMPGSSQKGSAYDSNREYITAKGVYV